MIRAKMPLVLIPGLLVAAALACTLPFSATPTPFVFPTPDLTMTAIFSPTQAVQPSPTAPQPPLPSETPTRLPAASPTATALPPSATPTPLPTQTPTLVPPTATPTNTAAPPTATQPPPEKRPRYAVEALYVDDPIEIDGEMDDWDLDRYEVEEVVYGDERWGGDDDLSAWAVFAWDEDYLYVAARVRDDEYVQNARTRELFKGDSLELLIDARVQADYFVDSLSSDDYQLGISPGSPEPGESPEAYLWYPAELEGKRNEVIIGAESVEGGYYVEVAIPWRVFSIEPDEGDHYGLAFSVSDNDRAADDVQQSMISNVPTRRLTDPTTWGDLELID